MLTLYPNGHLVPATEDCYLQIELRIMTTVKSLKLKDR